MANFEKYGFNFSICSNCNVAPFFFGFISENYPDENCRVDSKLFS